MISPIGPRQFWQHPTTRYQEAPKDQEKSRDFYVRILGGKLIKAENPCYIKLANSWIILNSGGDPTPDKPAVVLETPSNLNRVSSFLNLRVADIWACYKQWGAKGAIFLTEPLKNPDAGNGAAICVIPTGTSSKSANTRKWAIIPSEQGGTLGKLGGR